MDDVRSFRPLRDIIGDVASDAQSLFRGELTLARVEFDRKLKRALMALVWTFGGMFVAFAGLIVMLMAAVYALAYVIPVWAACLAIGFLIVAIGAGLILSGVKMLSLRSLTPTRTARNIRQDAELLREHV